MQNKPTVVTPEQIKSTTLDWTFKLVDKSQDDIRLPPLLGVEKNLLLRVPYIELMFLNSRSTVKAVKAIKDNGIFANVCEFHFQ